MEARSRVAVPPGRVSISSARSRTSAAVPVHRRECDASGSITKSAFDCRIFESHLEGLDFPHAPSVLSPDIDLISSNLFAEPAHEARAPPARDPRLRSGCGTFADVRRSEVTVRSDLGQTLARPGPRRADLVAASGHSSRAILKSDSTSDMRLEVEAEAGGRAGGGRDGQRGRGGRARREHTASSTTSRSSCDRERELVVVTTAFWFATALAEERLEFGSLSPAGCCVCRRCRW